MRFKFSLIQSLLWCSICSVPTFLTTYLYFKGLNASRVGLLLSIQTIFSFFGLFFWSYLSDEILGYKKTFIIGNIWMGLSFSLFFLKFDFVFLVFCSILLGFVQISLPVILDTWLLQIYFKNPEKYGPIRAIGSLSFAIFCLGYGILLNKYGFKIMPFFGILFIFFNILIALKTKDVYLKLKKEKYQDALKLFIKNKKYLLVLIIAFLYGVNATPFLQIIPVKIKLINGNLSQIGIAICISAISQLPPMMFYSKIMSFGVKKLFIFSFVFTIFSYLLYANTNSFNYLIISMFLNGIGFGIFLPTIRKYTFSLVLKTHASRAQSIVDSFQLCVAGVIGNLLTGLILKNLGLQFLVNTYTVILCILIIIVIIFFKKERRLNDEMV